MEDTQNVTEHTGFPNPATDATLAGLDISQLLVKHPASTFYMQIDGHSWEQAGIYHQDTVIIDRSLSPRTEDLVVWWKGQDFTIGRYKKLPPDTAIWGVITHTVHRYRS
jgi:DNA polymerase V